MQDLDSPFIGALLSPAATPLDSAIDPLALVYDDGTIAYLNQAERRLLDSAAADKPAVRLGEDYFGRLAALLPADAPDFAAVRIGLRSVLAAECTAFERDCRCQVGSQTRWLWFGVTACQIGTRSGVVVQKHDITVQAELRESLLDTEDRLALFATLTSDSLALSEKGIIIDVNRSMCTMCGYTREELIGQEARFLVAPESQALVRQHLINNTAEPYEAMGSKKDGSVFHCSIVGRPMRYQGRSIRGTFFRDLSALRAVEAELVKAEQDQLRAQSALLAELSTPLIPLTEQVVIMPLIGSVDSQRAQQVLEALLSGIESHRPRTVIIDITGVRLVDSHVAKTLVQAAQTAQLLGVQVLLTGIRAEVAQTLVRLGIDLSGIVTKSSVQAGIAYAIASQSHKESVR